MNGVGGGCATGSLAVGGPCYARLVFAIATLFSMAGLSRAESGGESGYLFRDKGFRVGPLAFSPGARAEMVFSDNVLNTPENRRDDLLQVYSPTMKLTLKPSDLAVFVFNYTPRWNDYVKDEIKDYFTHTANASLTLPRLLTEQFSLDLQAAYNEAQNTGLLEDELLRFERYSQVDYSINGTYVLPRGSLSGKFRRNSVSYDNEQAAGNSVGTQSSDFRFLHRVHDKKLAIVVRYSIDQTLPNEQAPLPPDPEEIAPEDDPSEGNVLAINSPVGSDTHTISAGFRGSVSRFTYDVTAGITLPQIIYDGHTTVSRNAQVEVEYLPLEKLKLSFLIAQGQSTDARTGRAFKRTAEGAPDILNQGDTGTQRSLSFFAAAEYRMNQRVKTDFEVGRYSVTGIRTGASTDTRVAIGATLNMTPRGVLGGGIARTESERFRGTRETTTYSLGFNWKFSDIASAGVKFDRNEERITQDNAESTDELETIVNTAQIGATVSW
ncbi:MAG TPA: hypothetical protein VEJ63_06495 [Planctomycetota bacterium]|nr:hypothetical protein [Planctomycetota bacterium]